ncbi:acyl-CoA dehydrogenase family protein [Phenylobacterium sp.]|jgi:alkylation response protein AidB-like acyl-CoA dehydrogenase|uniref:acyl-CoA dehydrogenase family protein n=1 Tax=Phenylobacterium sp. TaxID=1871053 RepID=UPI002E368161|nr:acyl-CoA dehydrogenase family protein [Phenylobacterium sp.]HEX3367262.1 acyl-CoA dehydrogenase family protein [Phenylobacterium sp.]
MDLDLTEDQAALVAAVQRLVDDHGEIPKESRRGSHFYSQALDRALTQNGFTHVMLESGLTALDAALVVEQVSRSPVVIEIGASALVAPHVADALVPRPIVLARGDLMKPQRFLPVAKSMLVEHAGDLKLLPVAPGEVEEISSVYGYPMGRFKAAPDLSASISLGASRIQPFRQWWRLSIAAEAAGMMQAAVEFTVDYVKQRRLFGTTVGNFQAVQHRLAHAYRIGQALHMLVVKAAWSGDAFDANQAASFAQQHIPKLTFDLHQFNGAMGVSNEHLLHFWTYRLKALQSEMGGANAAALDTADQLWGPAEPALV